MLVLKVDGQFSDNTLTTLERDPLLSGANDGVRFLFDAAFPYSYEGGAPANGSLVRDISDHANGSFVEDATDSVGFAGNGFDFSTLTNASIPGGGKNWVEAPSGVWSGIQAAQHFVVCFYVKMPISTDWNAGASLFSMFASSAVATYISAPDPITISQMAGNNLSFRRQTSVGAAVETVVGASTHFGLIAQVAYWRNAAGIGARIRSSAGTTLVAGGAGALNAADFSAAQPRFGCTYPFTNYTVADHRKARNFRLFRGFVEDLSLSGRVPATVLDADYARTIARGVFG